MIFEWERKTIGITDQQSIIVEDLEELLDIVEDFFESKVVFFEVREFQGNYATQGDYSHSVCVKFKNSKKQDPLIVGHLKSEKNCNVPCTDLPLTK